MGLVDGLGGEEVNQDVNVQTGSVITTGPISGAGTIFGANLVVELVTSGGDYRTGSIDSTGGITAVQSISGLNVLAQASGTFGRVVNTDGAMFSTSIDSGTAAVFGPRIQIGSSVTTAVGFGSAIFNTQFADTHYYWNAAVGSTGGFLTVDAGSWVVTISGIAGRNVSGVTFKGAPSTPYTWVAIGL